MQRIMATFLIRDIEDVWEDPNVKKGGITDFGNFDEGYCLKITTKDAGKTNWIVCFETIDEKEMALELTRDLKIQDQHKNGKMLIAPDDLKKSNKKYTISGLFAKEKRDDNGEDKEKEKVPVDGYWMILQNWSQCNLKCGGGTSTLHRMCVPPKNGGKPCVGQAITHRPCNTQPCPANGENGGADPLFNHYGANGSDKNTEVKKPIIKIMPFTNSPQRYTPCKIKESDLFIFIKNENTKAIQDTLGNKKMEEPSGDINIPSRVIMNNSTLSVYTGEDFDTLYLSFNLKKSNFFHSKVKKNCFQVNEGSKKSIVLCPFNSDKSELELEEWSRDFDMFKNKCARLAPYDPNSDPLLNAAIKKKMVITFLY